MAEAIRVSASGPPADPPSDRDLVAAARSGDREAFGQLVERHQDRAYRLALRLTGRPDEAADLTQEAFLKAWRALSGFEGHCAFYTWLFRIVVNEARSRLRAQAARPRSLSLDATGNDGDDRPLGDRGDAAAEDPSEALDRADRRRIVTRALDRLEPDQRLLIVLRDLEGRDYAEIAHALDCPRGTVKSRLHRARHALRGLLAPVLEPEEAAS